MQLISVMMRRREMIDKLPKGKPKPPIQITEEELSAAKEELSEAKEDAAEYVAGTDPKASQLTLAQWRELKTEERKFELKKLEEQNNHEIKKLEKEFELKKLEINKLLEIEKYKVDADLKRFGIK